MSLPPMSLPLPTPVFEAHSGSAGFGDLPDWDLTDLYPAPDSAEFARDMAELSRACAGFAAAYEGRPSLTQPACWLVSKNTSASTSSPGG